MSFNVNFPAASVSAEILRRGSSVLCNHARAFRSGTLPAIFITTPEIVPKSSLGDFASVYPRVAAPATNTISKNDATRSISAGVYAELRTAYTLQLDHHPKTGEVALGSCGHNAKQVRLLCSAGEFGGRPRRWLS